MKSENSGNGLSDSDGTDSEQVSLCRLTAAKNPLTLAFVGDAYWTLYIRQMITKSSNEKVNTLHRQANSYVSAVAQSGFFQKVAPHLNETETAIASRARNAHQHTTPKNCTLAEYKIATAFEAVVGFNYLIGDTDRLQKLFTIILGCDISK